MSRTSLLRRIDVMVPNSRSNFDHAVVKDSSSHELSISSAVLPVMLRTKSWKYVEFAARISGLSPSCFSFCATLKRLACPWRLIKDLTFMENGGHDSLSLEFHFGKAIVIFPVVFADWLGQAEDRLSWNSSSSSSMSADLLAAFFGGIVPQSVWAVTALNLSETGVITLCTRIDLWAWRSHLPHVRYWLGWLY